MVQSIEYPRMTDRQFITRVGTVVAALVVLSIVAGLLLGGIVVPERVQDQAWNAFTPVLGGLVLTCTGFLTYVNYRIANAGQANSNRNAAETQQAVANVEHKVTNGLAQRIGDIVSGEARQTAATLSTNPALSRQSNLAEQNTAAIAALSAKLDLLLLAATSQPHQHRPQAVPDATVVALQENTEAIDHNSDRTDANTQAREDHP